MYFKITKKNKNKKEKTLFSLHNVKEFSKIVRSTFSPLVEENIKFFMGKFF